MYKKTNTFEEAMTRLEEITADIQNNDTPLEDALKKYEEGRKLILFCRQKLSDVEQKLSVLDNDELLIWDLNDHSPKQTKRVVAKKNASQSEELFAQTPDNNDIPF